MADGTVVAPSSWTLSSSLECDAYLSGASVSSAPENLSFSMGAAGAAPALFYSAGSVSLGAPLEVPAGGTTPISWDFSKLDSVKNADILADAAAGVATLCEVSFTFSPELSAFAVYSADDESLRFYKRASVPSAGSVYEGLAATEVYTGIESLACKKISGTSGDGSDWVFNTPWRARRSEIKTVAAMDEGIRPISLRGWFAHFDSLERCDLSKMDGSAGLDCYGVFMIDKKLAELKTPADFAPTTLDDAFYFCASLETLDVSDWNASGCTSLFYAFYRCESLREATGIESLDVSRVATMTRTFYRDSKLSADLTAWTIRPSATATHQSFNEGAPGVILPEAWQAGAFAVYSADDNSLCFYKRLNCELPSAGASWNRKKATAVYPGIEATDYDSFGGDGTAGAEQAWSQYASSIKSVSVVDSGISPASMAYWFAGFTSMASCDVSKLDSSACPSFRGTWLGCSSLASLGLSRLDITSCADFSLMFSGCSALVLDLSAWEPLPGAAHEGFADGAPGVVCPAAWATAAGEGSDEAGVSAEGGALSAEEGAEGPPDVGGVDGAGSATDPAPSDDKGNDTPEEPADGGAERDAGAGDHRETPTA